MSASNDLENKALDHILGGPDYTRLATVYISLHTADPGEAGTPQTNEATGTGYARVAVTNNATNWPAAAGGAKSNGTAINFPTPGSGGWSGGSPHTHFGIGSTASGAGVLLFSGALAVSKVINQDDVVSFAIGDLDITAD
jgi:hypothetical protein